MILVEVRSFAIEALEVSANAGHTLDFPDNVAADIQAMAVSPSCPVTSDSINVMVTSMQPEVVTVNNGDGIAFQLQRYQTIGNLIRRQIRGRVGVNRHSIAADWERLVAGKFGAPRDHLERRAQSEKAAALAELAAKSLFCACGPRGDR